MADSDTIGALMVAANSFLTDNGLAAEAIAWPNKAFDPAGKALWARVSHVPNAPTVATLGIGGRDRGTGFLQIDLNVPENAGDGTFRDWENYAREYFVAGGTFTRSGQTVRVISCAMSQGRTVDNWFRKSITVVYRSDFTRADPTALQGLLVLLDSVSAFEAAVSSLSSLTS